jgi:DnaK suppressor protein
MNAEVKEIKSMLESKREEVLRRLHRLEDITVERAPDPVDEMEMTVERESAITLLERDSELLRQIDGALRRIEDDDFGRCELCGKDIGFRRLRVVPWAVYCVACQDEVDRSRAREGSGTLAVEPGV